MALHNVSGASYLAQERLDDCLWHGSGVFVSWMAMASLRLM